MLPLELALGRVYNVPDDVINDGDVIVVQICAYISDTGNGTENQVILLAQMHICTYVCQLILGQTISFRISLLRWNWKQSYL